MRTDFADNEGWRREQELSFQEKARGDQRFANLAFETARRHRKTWIQRLQLDAFEYQNSRQKTIKVCRCTTEKAVLLAIESVGRDGGPACLKIETLADFVSVSGCTISRAVSCLVARGLIKVAHNHDARKASEYQIQWAAVAEVLLNNPKTAGFIVPRQKEEVVERQARQKSDQKRTVAASALEKRFGQTESDIVEHEPEQVKAVPGDDGGWGRKLTVNDFRDREAVQRLFEIALERKFVDLFDRARFFTLAKYVSRMAGQKNGVQKPGAYFTAQLRDRNWLGDDSDKRAALNAISLIDGGRS